MAEQKSIWTWLGEAGGRLAEVINEPVVVKNVAEAALLVYVKLVYIVEGRVAEL